MKPNLSISTKYPPSRTQQYRPLSSRSSQSDREKVLSRAQLIEKRLNDNVGSLKKNSSRVWFQRQQTPTKRSPKNEPLQMQSPNTLGYSRSRAEILHQIADKLKDKPRQPPTTKNGFSKLGGIMKGIKKFNKEGQTIHVIKQTGGYEEISTQNPLTEDEKFTLLLREFGELRNQFQGIKYQNEELLRSIKTQYDQQRGSTSTFYRNRYQFHSPDSQRTPVRTPTNRNSPFIHEDNFSCSSSVHKKITDWKIPCFSCGCTCQSKNHI